MISPKHYPLLEAALAAREANLSYVPVMLPKKKPTATWKALQTRQPTEAEGDLRRRDGRRRTHPGKATADRGGQCGLTP